MTEIFHARSELKGRRLSLNLTTSELSCMAGVNRTSLDRWESGSRDITGKSLLAIIHALGFKIVSDEDHLNKPDVVVVVEKEKILEKTSLTSFEKEEILEKNPPTSPSKRLKQKNEPV